MKKDVLFRENLEFFNCWDVGRVEVVESSRVSGIRSEQVNSSKQKNIAIISTVMILL